MATSRGYTCLSRHFSSLTRKPSEQLFPNRRNNLALCRAFIFALSSKFAFILNRMIPSSICLSIDTIVCSQTKKNDQNVIKERAYRQPSSR